LKYPHIQYLPIKKQDEGWAKSDKEKIETFAIYFSKIFKPISREITTKEGNKLLSEAIIAAIQGISTKSFTITELSAVIKKFSKKVLIYDLIRNLVL